MQYLVPLVLSSSVVDRYDIWINTHNKLDIAFFEELAKNYPKVNLVYQPNGEVDGNRTINAFWQFCLDDDAIYIRLDDDIVWMEPDFFEKMIRFRTENPEYFVTSPLVINNALSTYILQNCGKIKLREYVRANSNDSVTWASGDFAAEIHEWFLGKIADGSYVDLHCGKKPIAMNRFSINCVSWFGNTFKKFGGDVYGDEEEFVSVVKPTELGAMNCFNTDVIASHFAFFTQRDLLDKKDILHKYGKALEIDWARSDGKSLGIYMEVKEILRRIETNKEEILKRKGIYEGTTSARKFLRRSVSSIKVPLLKFTTVGRIYHKVLDRSKRFIISGP